LVLNGNMKNRRDVCAAVDAGYTEYAGLPGEAKTGCMETPDQRSKFCSLHKPWQVDQHSRKEKGDTQGRLVEMILSKTETRTSVLYEVFNMIVHL